MDLNGASPVDTITVAAAAKLYGDEPFHLFGEDAGERPGDHLIGDLVTISYDEADTSYTITAEGGAASTMSPGKHVRVAGADTPLDVDGAADAMRVMDQHALALDDALARTGATLAALRSHVGPPTPAKRSAD